MNWTELFSRAFPEHRDLFEKKSIKGFSTDSRDLKQGEVFFALKGDRFDGHAFVESALKQGASFSFANKSAKRSKVDGVIEVNDTVDALRQLAGEHRKTLDTRIVCIGGSNGKTTTKEWLAFLLQALDPKKPVYRTRKSENSILGVALNLLRIRDEEIAVLEVGIDEPGWMKKHLELIQPQYGLITSINEEHLDLLKDIETVAKEELELLNHIRTHGGKFAANLDSDWIRLEEPADEPSVDCLSYSLHRKADIEGRFATPNILHAFGVEFRSPLPGAHNAQNLLAALSMLRLIRPDIQKSEIDILQHELSKFRGEAHRSQWVEFNNGVYVFDDCYNANPTSMESALQTFIEIAQGSSTRVILGDMFDLGTESEKAHKRIINLVSVMDFSEVMLVGSNFSEAVKATKQIPSHVKAFENLEDLEQELKKLHFTDQSILIKGSRGMGLERLIPIWEKL